MGNREICKLTISPAASCTVISSDRWLELTKALGRKATAHIYLLAVPLYVMFALALPVFSRTWIESVFAVDPDGGSGLVELLLVFVPIAISIAVAADKFCRLRSHDLRNRSFPSKPLLSPHT